MENENEQTIFEKGLNLEERFAKYIIKEMGYTNYKIRWQVKAASNSRGTNVDIIGQRLDYRGKNFNRLAIIYLILFAIILIIAIILTTNKTKSDDNIADAFFISSIICEIIGGIAVLLSNKFNIENIWIECKNLKGKVNISQIRKMIVEIQDYKNSRDKKYKFKEFAFVSASGFIDNAIELAQNNGIKCFIIDQKNKFQWIKSWN